MEASAAHYPLYPVNCQPEAAFIELGDLGPRSRAPPSASVSPPVSELLKCRVYRCIWSEDPNLGATPLRPSCFLGKCPTGWHHYEGTASCYRVYLSGENYWDAAQTCQRVNGSLAIFSTDQELRFVLAQEWDQPERSFAWQDQHK